MWPQPLCQYQSDNRESHDKSKHFITIITKQKNLLLKVRLFVFSLNNVMSVDNCMSWQTIEYRRKYYLKLARLFEAVQCVQNMKLRLRLLTKESLQFTIKWNKNPALYRWGPDNRLKKKELNKSIVRVEANNKNLFFDTFD